MADSYLWTDYTRGMSEAEETYQCALAYVEEIHSALEKVRELEWLMQELEQKNARFHELLGMAQESVGMRLD
jgi:hypothetical protein